MLSLSFPSSLAALGCQVSRHSHTAVEWMGNMVIFGGELANGSLASDVWMYRPLPDDWQQLGFSSTRGSPKLANHAAAVVDDYLYVFGGGFHVTSSSNSQCWNRHRFLSWEITLLNLFPRSHWGGHVFFFSVSLRPTWLWAVGDGSAHWR